MMANKTGPRPIYQASPLGPSLTETAENEPNCIEHAPWKLLRRLALSLGAITTSTPKLPRCRAKASDWLRAGTPGKRFQYHEQGISHNCSALIRVTSTCEGSIIANTGATKGFPGLCWLRNGGGCRRWNRKGGRE